MRHKLPAMLAKAGSIALLFAATLMLVASTFGQTQATAADLSGTVTDPNGAVVSGATVTARNSATGISKTITVDAAFATYETLTTSSVHSIANHQVTIGALPVLIVGTQTVQ